MHSKSTKLKHLLLTFLSFSIAIQSLGQLNNTVIKGFVDVIATNQNNKSYFSLGEQDLFITSELSDRLNFLGESVFKYSNESPTLFDVSIERVVLKYNYKGNHNILLGKHHTPLNYWNDTYHHGRVFFPTIYRPLMFSNDLIPLHTTGVDFQGSNLGELKFGYDILIGNGISANDISDDNKNKCITAASHIKPKDGLRIGLSYYNDLISPENSSSHHGTPLNQYHKEVKQQLVNASVSYFEKKYEFLAEGTYSINHTDSTGNATSQSAYIYAGYKVKEKIIPYAKVDFMNFDSREIYYSKNNTLSLLAGIRYQINYLAVLKLEFEFDQTQYTGNYNKLSAQFAIGF